MDFWIKRFHLDPSYASKDLDELFVALYKSAQFKGYPQHSIRIESNPFYSQEEFKKYIYNTFAIKVENAAMKFEVSGFFVPFNSKMIWLKQVSPPVVSLKLFSKETDIFIETMVNQKRIRALYATLSGDQVARSLLFEKLYQKRFDEDFPLEAIFINPISQNQYPLPVFDYDRPGQYSKDKVSELVKLIRQKRNPDTTTYRSHLDLVNRNLGAYALFDLVLDGDLFWPLMQKVNGWGKKKLHAELRKSLIHFLQQKNLSDSKFAGLQTEITLGTALKAVKKLDSYEDSPLVWLNQDVCMAVINVGYSLSDRPEFQEIVYRKMLPRCQRLLPSSTYAALSTKHAFRTEAEDQRNLFSHYEDTFEAFYGKGAPSFNFHFYFVVNDIVSSKISRELKENYLNLLFLKRIPKYSRSLAGYELGAWVYSTLSLEVKTQLIQTMIEYGVSDSLFEYLEKIRSFQAKNFDPRRFSQELMEPSFHFEQDLYKRLDELDLSEALQLFNTYYGKEFHIHANKAKRYPIEELTAVTRRALGYFGERAENLNDLIHLINSLTRSGPLKEADELVKSRILKGTFCTEQPEQCLSLLKEKDTLSNTHLKLQIFRLANDSKLADLKKESFHQKYLFITNLKKHVPEPSKAKDDYIEELAWKLQISGTELLVIEEEKATNFRQLNPYLVDASSLFAESMENESLNIKRLALEYVIEPENKSIPKPVKEVLEKYLTRFLDDYARHNQSDSRFMAGQAIEKIEENIRNSEPGERIPLIQILLTLGKDTTLLTDEAYRSHMLRDLIGFEEGSRHIVLFKSYLKVIDPVEEPTSWAYMLAQSNDGHKGISGLFSLFQTPGKKLGQLISIFNLLGPEIAEETKPLKTMAPALSKYQIESILKKKGLEGKFILKKILGAAGIKTVVLVEVVATGEKAVLCLQDEYAVQNTKTNIELMRQFIQQAAIDLQDKGFPAPGPFFMAVVNDLEKILEVELDFTNEAKSMRKAAKFYKRHTIKSEDLEVVLTVPAVRDDIAKTQKDLLIMDFAGGKSWDELKEVYLEEHSSKPLALDDLGEVISKNVLSMFFKTGFIHTDPHGENVRVDFQPDNKFAHIFLIDWGQAFQSESNFFSQNSRVQTIRFLKGIASKDVELILLASQRMAKNHHELSNETSSQAKELLSEVFSDNPEITEKAVISALDAIYKSSIKLEPVFAIGILKAFIYLLKEGYVTERVLSDVIRETGLYSAILEQISIRKNLILRGQDD